MLYFHFQQAKVLKRTQNGCLAKNRGSKQIKFTTGSTKDHYVQYG